MSRTRRVARSIRDSSYCMRIVILCAAFAAIASSAAAQVRPAPAKTPFWDDTLAESPIYPVGDATPVYRAVLDFIYLDGDKRPPVIIMHDSAEGHMGGPCPFDRCPGGTGAWPHKSRMDSATVMSYARLTRRRPAITQFGYPIPIVLISYDDVKRMDADGRELLAQHPMPADLPQPQGGFWAELKRKYPGAWGVTTLTKVGFNKRHTEALVQVHQWCGDDCRVHETLFLRQTRGAWKVVERIPAEVDPGRSPDARYLGPAGTTPKESELVPVEKPGVPTEAMARNDVYRAILDSLYYVEGGGPKAVVLTNWFPAWGHMPAHTSAIDSALIKRFILLGGIRAPLDAITSYRIPLATLPVDSVPALRERGAKLDAIPQTGYPFWLAFTKKFPGAWGTLGVTRIAFNADRSQALVYTYHACGEGCFNVDTWYLTRSDKTWQIAERMTGQNAKNVALEPLRYLGLDADASASRPRRVRGILTDPVTGKPVSRFEIFVKRMLNSGVNVNDPSLMTDSLGQFTLTNLPLEAAMTLIFRCPNGARDPVDFKPIYVTPGLDTTMNLTFEVSLCTQPPPGASPATPSMLGVSSIPHGPSSAQRFRWMYFTPSSNPGFRTWMTTCLNLIPGNEKYPPGEVVACASTASVSSPSMIATSAPGTARLFRAVTMPLTVLGAVDGGGPSGSWAVSESS
jgi:hypothetical protein